MNNKSVGRHEFQYNQDPFRVNSCAVEGCTDGPYADVHRVVEPTDNQESVKGREGTVATEVVIPKDNSLWPIYVASRASVPERGAMWRMFRAGGVPITSSWVDEDGEGASDSMEELWARITNEIADSFALVLYAEPADFPLKGAFIEAGIALGMGKPVIVCLPNVEVEQRSCRPIGSWINHPLVSRVDDITAAVMLASRPDTKSSEARHSPNDTPASSLQPQSESAVEPERCEAFQPSILGVPEPEDRCVREKGHTGKHSRKPTVAPTTEVPAEPEDWAIECAESIVRGQLSSAAKLPMSDCLQLMTMPIARIISRAARVFQGSVGRDETFGNCRHGVPICRKCTVNDALTTKPTTAESLTRDEVESVLAPMMCYAKIATVDGVKYQEGSHEEIIRLYESLLNRLRATTAEPPAAEEMKN